MPLVLSNIFSMHCYVYCRFFNSCVFNMALPSTGEGGVGCGIVCRIYELQLCVTFLIPALIISTSFRFLTYEFNC